jgi:hypothetical protein
MRNIAVEPMCNFTVKIREETSYTPAVAVNILLHRFLRCLTVPSKITNSLS